MFDPNGDLIPDTHSHAPAPGTECPTCRRRVSHPRKESSPDTKVVAKRVPLDEAEAHEAVAVAAAEHLGVYGRPHWRFQLDTFAYARVLQDASLKDVGRAA
jgi:hypothetical protein